MDPFTIGAILSALLTAYSSQQSESANKKVVESQGVALAAERARQQKIDQERQAAIAADQPKFTPGAQEETRQTIAKNLETYLKPTTERTAAEAEYSNAANPGAPKEIADSGARALSGAMQKGQDYAKNLAQLSSLKNLNFGNALTLSKLGTTVGQANTSAKMSADTLPFELGAAGHAGEAATTRASAAQGLGSIAAMYAAANVPTGAAATPALAPNVGTGYYMPTGPSQELVPPIGSSLGLKLNPYNRITLVP